VIADRLLHEPWVRSLGRAARDLAGLLMPSLCVVCERRDGTVCPACAPLLTAALLHPFRAEGDAAALPLVEDPAVDPLVADPAGPDASIVEGAVFGAPPEVRAVPVVAAARYGPEVFRTLLAFKDHGRTTAGRYLRPAVHRALAAAPELWEAAGPFTLVPVPGSAAGFRRRGYDPVEELLSGRLPPGWEVDRGLLAHRREPLRGWGRPRASHAGSGSAQRRHRNLGRFVATRRASAAPDVRARNVVLFDDVLTTGSTLAAAWCALDRAGIRPVGAVVLTAVTGPRTASVKGLNSA
jgi:predicted amidophosphoribosyltransferase